MRWLLASLILAGAIVAVPEDMFNPLLTAVHLFHNQDEVQDDYELVEAEETSCLSPFIDIEGRCLYYDTNMINWTSAQKACEAINGNLIEISSEDQDPLSDYMHNKTVDSYIYGAFWTGGTDKVEEDDWVWLSGNFVDGSWGEDESNNITGTDENCLMLDAREAIYKDQKCSFPWAYICEPGPCYNITCGIKAHCVIVNYMTNKCTCDTGYEGDAYTECSEINPCDPDPCVDHAVCTSQDWDSYHCNCEVGYTGDGNVACEYDPCYNVTCGTNAKCEKLSNSTFECRCFTGFTGNAQQGCTKIDYCEGINCEEHASCHVDVHTPECRCDSGYHNIANPPDVQCSGGDKSIGSISWPMLLLTLSVTVLLSHQNESWMLNFRTINQ